MDTIGISIFSAVISAIAAAIITRYYAKKTAEDSNSIHVLNLSQNIKTLEKNHNVLNIENRTIKEKLQLTEKLLKEKSEEAKKYHMIRKNLQELSRLVIEYSQPVVLVGPRNVGKTSLLKQLHAPWDRNRVNPTPLNYSRTIPVYDYKGNETAPHFADTTLFVPLSKHLSLEIHDFPGEISMQMAISEIIKEETIAVREATSKDIGVVLICMFDAEEAKIGLSRETNNYYNGDLFRELRSLVTYQNASLGRVILVFNKYDNLKKYFRDKRDKELMEFCVDRFSSLIKLLQGACNQEKICEVFTILSRDEMQFNNKGATIVLAEAARNIVKAIVGEQAMHEHFPGNASNISGEILKR